MCHAAVLLQFSWQQQYTPQQQAAEAGAGEQLGLYQPPRCFAASIATAVYGSTVHTKSDAACSSKRLLSSWPLPCDHSVCVDVLLMCVLAVVLLQGHCHVPRHT